MAEQTKAKPKRNTKEDSKPEVKEPVKVTAVWKNAPSSPQKARLVADLVRGMNAKKALETLKLTNKKASALIWKVIRSAMANAEHAKGVDPERLVITRILVDDGLKFRRFRAVARGQAHGFVRRRAHILVELEAK